MMTVSRLHHVISIAFHQNCFGRTWPGNKPRTGKTGGLQPAVGENKQADDDNDLILLQIQPFNSIKFKN